MKNQPFLLITLEDGTKKMINEAQIVSVEKHEKNYASLRMSNGDTIIVKSPTYEAWENDCHSRKD